MTKHSFKIRALDFFSCCGIVCLVFFTNNIWHFDLKLPISYFFYRLSATARTQASLRSQTFYWMHSWRQNGKWRRKTNAFIGKRRMNLSSFHWLLHLPCSHDNHSEPIIRHCSSPIGNQICIALCDIHYRIIWGRRGHSDPLAVYLSQPSVLF